MKQSDGLQSDDTGGQQLLHCELHTTSGGGEGDGGVDGGVGEGGGRNEGGGRGAQYKPQSAQSLPSWQKADAEPARPSSQNPSEPQSGIPTHALLQMHPGCKGGGSGDGHGGVGGGGTGGGGGDGGPRGGGGGVRRCAERHVWWLHRRRRRRRGRGER